VLFDTRGVTDEELSEGFATCEVVTGRSEVCRNEARDEDEDEPDPGADDDEGVRTFSFTKV
jgi:hypothetical protein